VKDTWAAEKYECIYRLTQHLLECPRCQSKRDSFRKARTPAEYARICEEAGQVVARAFEAIDLAEVEGALLAGAGR
jgi:hypothetical protein